MVEMTKQSLAYWAFGLFFMVYLWIDSVMLSLMTRSEVVGWYGVPTRLFQTLLFVPVIASTAWLPRLVSSFTEGMDRLKHAARVPLELVLAVSLPVCAATAIGARPVIHLLYGPAYANAVPVMVLLGLCIPPMYLNIMLSQVLVAAKRQVLWTWVMAGATIVNPLLNAVLITATEHRYGNGAIGASISLVLTELLIVAVGFVIVGRGVLVRSSVARCGRVALASGAMYAVGRLARPFGAPASLGAAALAFVVLAAALRVVSANERAAVRAWVVRAAPGIPSPRGEWRRKPRRLAAEGVEGPAEPGAWTS
jgi:O-antigen/teichoic acid export membrane protein